MGKRIHPGMPGGNFDPAHVHTTSYGHRAVCNPAFNPSPAPPPPPGTLVPGCVPPPGTEPTEPERFNGLGGSGACPGPKSRGLPATPFDRREKPFKGWHMERTGRGHAAVIGEPLRRSEMLDKEHQLATICDVLGKQAFSGQFCSNPEKFKVAAKLAGVPLTPKTLARVDARMPEEGFNPVLDRSSYNQLLKPLSQRSKFSVQKTDFMAQGKSRPRGGTPHGLHAGMHGGLRPPGSSRSSMKSFATRTSVASAENKILREQNAMLEAELAEAKGMKSGRTNGSLRSRSTTGGGSLRSFGSRRSTARGLSPQAAAVIKQLKSRGDQLPEYCQQYDSENTGSISKNDLQMALVQIGACTHALADSTLDELFSLCPHQHGQIKYNDLARRVRSITLPSDEADRMSVHQSDTGSRPCTNQSGYDTVGSAHHRLAGDFRTENMF